MLQLIARSTVTIVVAVTGGAVTTAGLVMLVTPGPGLLVIVAGLAILATQFAWAERALDRMKDKAKAAKEAAARRVEARRVEARRAARGIAGPAPGDTLHLPPRLGEEGEAGRGPRGGLS